jgi:hypothetical protein
VELKLENKKLRKELRAELEFKKQQKSVDNYSKG